MKIQNINSVSQIHQSSCFVNKQNLFKKSNAEVNSNLLLDLHYNKIFVSKINLPKTVTFMGSTVHIVDGSNHAKNMKYFAKAISSDMDIKMHEVETNPKHKDVKQLKSLEEQLKLLNKKSRYDGEYIAIPALASVPLLNLRDQFNSVMGDYIDFTPENIKVYHEDLIEFLKRLYNSPDKYRTFINNMDSTKQGIQYTYGIIKEINYLVDKGAHVYIPSGHPQDQSLKWLAGERGLKPELYHYIATGKDIDGKIQEIHNEIKSKNWYEFNLLSLSNANIVGVKQASGAQDYMFAAYDTYVSDGARGVYNLSPIRKNGKITGYSFTDEYTNQYPYYEFPDNEKIANIAKYVGIGIRAYEADEHEISALKYARKHGKDLNKCPDKLYPINKIFTEEEIRRNKLDLQGKYVDRTGKLFFDLNINGQIVFPKLNCEGSDKPSVYSMWGSCFATFNAIARDIENSKHFHATKSLESHKDLMHDIIMTSFRYSNNGNYKMAENCLNYAIEQDKLFKFHNRYHTLNYIPHKLLGDIHFNDHSYDYASSCYNHAINALANEVSKAVDKRFERIKRSYNDYQLIKRTSEEYDKDIKYYNNANIFTRFLLDEPERPLNYNKHFQYEWAVEQMNNLEVIADIYEKLAIICERKGEDYSAEICNKAAKDIRNGTDIGCEILSRRADNIQFIGDIYEDPDFVI